MLDADLPATNPDTEERLSRRNFLFGFAVLVLSRCPCCQPQLAPQYQCCTPAWIRSLLRPESEIIRVGRGGGRGGGGRGVARRSRRWRAPLWRGGRHYGGAVAGELWLSRWRSQLWPSELWPS